MFIFFYYAILIAPYGQSGSHSLQLSIHNDVSTIVLPFKSSITKASEGHTPAPTQVNEV